MDTMFLCGILTILLATVLAIPSSSCPHGCSCSKLVVSCHHSNLTSLPSNLPFAETIEHLKLPGNTITHIGQEIQSYPSLKTVDFASNNISVIEDGAFKGLINVMSLILRRNYLTKFTNKTFEGLVNLHTLDLGYNMLKHLSDYSFTELKNLDNLDLMKNNMSSIENYAFIGTTSLRVLNLTSNLLLNYPTIPLSKLTALRRLVLDDNELKSIPSFAFSNHPGLTFLSLNGNHIDNVDPFAFAMSHTAVASPLEELSLKGMDLTVIPMLAFSRLTNLVKLDISKNVFKVLEKGTFAKLTKLRQLTIKSSKYLSAIKNGTFQHMLNLEVLTVTDNPVLTTIEQSVFPTAPTLLKIDLSSNSVKTFHRSIVDWIRNVSVDMRRNNLLCDCQILWMISTLKSAPNTFTKNYAQNLTCASPENLKGKVILSLNLQDFKCDGPKAAWGALKRVQVAAIVASITCVVLCTVLVLFKLRKKLCLVLRRQYRYHQYKNSGVFTTHKKAGAYDDGKPMQVFRSSDDEVLDNADMYMRD